MPIIADATASMSSRTLDDGPCASTTGSTARAPNGSDAALSAESGTGVLVGSVVIANAPRRSGTLRSTQSAPIFPLRLGGWLLFGNRRFVDEPRQFRTPRIVYQIDGIEVRQLD